MAVRIILKRSSIPNKRPNADLLEPGEIALNTNALTPGLFFEADNNKIIKVGPPSVGLNVPNVDPSLGEMFFDSISNELSVGDVDTETAAAIWKKVTTPFLGGTNGYVCFVATEFPTASDSILNDGQAAPFKTLNRAIIEISKLSIQQQNQIDTGERFTIIVAPGITPVYNGPGIPLKTSTGENNFSVNFEAANPSIPDVLTLQQFNSPEGGMFVPRGTSILGMDYRKTQLRPTYVPTVVNPSTNQGSYQPLTAILKWTGDSLLETFTFRDKRENVEISDFKSDAAGTGVFVSTKAHCFGYNDLVTFNYAAGTNQITPSGNVAALSGQYYVFPLTATTFLLSSTSIAQEANYIQRSDLPVGNQGLTFLATAFWPGRTANRVRAVFPASIQELDDFYVKIQSAFPIYFNNKINQAEVINPGETQIVAPIITSLSSQSLISDSTEHASPYAHQIGLRSNYGMCGIEQDGNLVTGFKSALVSEFTAVSLQNDPVAYEIYATLRDVTSNQLVTNWYPLQFATWSLLPASTRPVSISDTPQAAQLELLNLTEIVNIRWYYESQLTADNESIGLANFDRDFRHFAIRARNGAYIQADSCWSVGQAAAFWALNGGKISLSNSSSNFGAQSLRAEGFAGLGSSSSDFIPEQSNSGFIFSGIRMPTKVTASDTLTSRRLELGPSILAVTNVANGVQNILIGDGFKAINIQPFSLIAGSCVYALSGATEFRATLVEDGNTPVTYNNVGQAILRVRSIDSSFPLGTIDTLASMKDWSSVFIKRWSDPRTVSESSYALVVETSNTDHRIPSIGSILRLDQTSAGSSRLLRPNVQFDPGITGGWGRIFEVSFSQTNYDGDSPQFNEILLNRAISNVYYVGLNLIDASRPWLSDNDHAHGSFTTYENRNWYAASNDDWKGIYFSSEGVPAETALKLNPAEFNSVWATSASSELLTRVNTAYQGIFAPDPEITLYNEYGYYYRGDQPAIVNYGFELAVNIDDGSPSFGFLNYTVPVPNDTSTTTTVLTPLEDTVTVLSTLDFPSPFLQFFVVALTSGTRTPEYCQVLRVNTVTNELTLKRGLYGSKATTDWPIGTDVTEQSPSSSVNPLDYDFDWAPSKSAVIRFLQVMGYKDVDIQKLLRPETRSNRIVQVNSISLSPENGYAIATGPFPLTFNNPSTINVSAQSFNYVGYISYSKGLPTYLGNEIPTKQYFDYLNSFVWGGKITASSSDEKGNLPLAGELKQLETGRPYGSSSSLIGDNTRVTGDSGGSSGGGAGTVKIVFTGIGLSGGPIVTEGTIDLIPPTQNNIGGVKEGSGVNIAADGAISAAASGDPNIIGGVKQGDNIVIDPDGTINAIVPPPSPLGIAILDVLIFNGLATNYPLTSGGIPVVPKAAQFCLIVLGGVVQGTPFNFTVSGSNITFSDAPQPDTSFYGIVFSG